MYALAFFIYRSPTAHLIQRGPFRLHFLTPVDKGVDPGGDGGDASPPVF